MFFASLLAKICCCKVVLFLVRDEVFTHGGGAWITSRTTGREHANFDGAVFNASSSLDTRNPISLGVRQPRNNNANRKVF